MDVQWMSLLAQAGEGAQEAVKDPGLLTYFTYSNFSGQLIVILLMCFSLLAWYVMIGKYLDLNRLRLINQIVEKKLNTVDSVTEINLKGKDGGPYGKCIEAAVDAWERFATADGDPAVCMGHVENALQRTVANQTMRYESKMTMLGSIVSGAPFMGLLGTVWGVMDAFGGMAHGTGATLQNLAPGVSGALLTTVMALLVAIPSVFGYNHLLTRSRSMVTELENFASSLADRVELEMTHG